jgi:uncharacterized protein involved in response to NO
MTLAIMSRASLGHTGRALNASRMTQVLYLMVVLGAFARIGAALEPAWNIPMLQVAGLSWGWAFVGFVIVYWITLTHPKVVGRS